MYIHPLVSSNIAMEHPHVFVDFPIPNDLPEMVVATSKEATAK